MRRPERDEIAEPDRRARPNTTPASAARAPDPALDPKPSRNARGPLRPLSVAPMMDRTNRHFRYFLRILTRHTLLYTEMIPTAALVHGDRDRFLEYAPEEHPVALQLGGDDPAELADCARLGADRGYDEINLNVGCPSDAVQRGRFGACLMAEPERVADAVAAMRDAVAVPVTVKHRIGIDDLDRYGDMERFVRTVAAAGCDRFSVHARKAWLSGLSPKQNRSVPPLRYDDVRRLKREHPELRIEINGGIRSLDEAKAHLADVDGVLIGRAAYDDPFLFARADDVLFGEEGPSPVASRTGALERYLPYVEREHARGTPIRDLTTHLHGLFAGVPGARSWRRFLADRLLRRDASVADFHEALASTPPVSPAPTKNEPTTTPDAADRESGRPSF